MTHARFSKWFLFGCLAAIIAFQPSYAFGAGDQQGILTPDQLQQAQASIQQLQQKISSASTLADQQKAVQALIDKIHELIKNAPDDPHRPIWQTTLTQTLIMNVLTGEHNRAIAFAQFGVTSKSQQQALEKFATEALKASDAATTAIFNIQRDLASGHTPANLTPALRATLINDYAEQRLPFFGGWAEIAVAVQPDTSPYFANLGKPSGVHVAHQKLNPDAERKRLGLDAAARLQSLAQGAGTSTLQYQSLLLLGRAQLIAGHGAKAQQAFDQVIAANPQGYLKLETQLGKAYALHLQKKDDDAIALLDQASKEKAVVGQPLLALLVTDAKHRILLDKAGKDKAAINKAYAVYDQFLSEPWLGKSAESLRQYIASRWAFHLADEKPQFLPPAVRLGVGRLERMQGQNDALQTGNQHKGQISGKAKTHLQNAVKFLSTLTDKSVPSDIRARGMYNLAIAKYLLDQHDSSNIFAVAKMLSQVAKQMPDQPVAQKAINNAVALTHQLFALDSPPSGAKQAYEQAAQILFDKFPLSGAASDERLFYASQIFIPAGEYQKAIDYAGKIPLENPNYFYAQSDRLVWMKHQIDHPGKTPGSATPTISQVIKAAEAVQKKATPVMKTGHGDRADAAKRAVAQAVLIQADLAAREGDAKKALKLIDNFDARFAGQDDLIAQADRQRLLFLIADTRIDEAGKIAKKLVQDKPQEGVAIVNGVLIDLTNQVDRLRTRARNNPTAADHQKWLNQAQSSAQTASELAKLMDNWARQQHKTGKKLLPYQLMLARSELAAGNADTAVQHLEPLLKAYPNRAQIIQLLADALFQKGGKAALDRAAKYYGQLIGGLSDSHPPMFWHAWVQFLRINQRLNKHTDEIALNVRRLQHIDPNLGGEPYKQELLGLKQQYEQN